MPVSGTFIEDTEIAAEVAAIHRIAANAAPASWAVIITNANKSAYREIIRVLSGRGFTNAQILAWDDGPDFNRNLGVCAAMRKIGLPENQESMSLREICKAKDELKLADVLVDDVIVSPESTTGKNVTYGNYSTTNDTFTMDSEL